MIARCKDGIKVYKLRLGSSKDVLLVGVWHVLQLVGILLLGNVVIIVVPGNDHI